ncbi:MAG TPA: DUF1761 family protein [Pseudacidobacterium sp.]|jgi:hypothetical protein|nr:DUF1761 family protein [Pseudacidobacterium sp.]
MAEWLFSGDNWMPLYRRYPETWRSSGPNYSEKGGIIFATIFAFISAALFFLVLCITGVHGWVVPCAVALLLWMIVPVPLLFTLSFFMKYPRALALVHATGWLLKLVIFTVAFAVFRL